MSTAARKARKRAGVPFTKEPKVATRPWESKRDAQKRRAADARAAATASGQVASGLRSMYRKLSSSLRQAGGKR